jgi:hypothetical protein
MVHNIQLHMFHCVSTWTVHSLRHLEFGSKNVRCHGVNITKMFRIGAYMFTWAYSNCIAMLRINLRVCWLVAWNSKLHFILCVSQVESSIKEFIKKRPIPKNVGSLGNPYFVY